MAEPAISILELMASLSGEPLYRACGFEPGDADAFQHRLQLAQLDHLTASKAAATTLAENYVG